MAKNQDKYWPNGTLHIFEIIAGYCIVVVLGYLAFWTIKNTTHETFAVFVIILAVTLILFLIVFRKRPISFNAKVGLTSGIDIRWCLKKDEELIEKGE